MPSRTTGSKGRSRGVRSSKTAGPSGKSPPADERYRNVLEYITPEFVEQGAHKIRREDVRDVVRKETTIREQLGAGTMLDRFRAEALVLVDLLREYDRGGYDASLWAVAVGTYALQYLVKPVDIIPDTLPVVGQLDDALVLSHALVLIRRDLHAFKVWKLATEALRD